MSRTHLLDVTESCYSKATTPESETLENIRLLIARNEDSSDHSSLWICWILKTSCQKFVNTSARKCDNVISLTEYHVSRWSQSETWIAEWEHLVCFRMWVCTHAPKGHAVAGCTDCSLLGRCGWRRFQLREAESPDLSSTTQIHYHKSNTANTTITEDNFSSKQRWTCKQLIT